MNSTSILRITLSLVVVAMLAGISHAQAQNTIGQSFGATVQSAVKYRLPFSPDDYDGVVKYFDHDGRDWGGGTIRYAKHQGTDYRMPVGTPVLAAATGIPFKTYNQCPDIGEWEDDCGDSFGNHVRLRHADGRVTIYAHLKASSVIPQSQTQAVQCGQQIGESASSGWSDGPHLHFEVRQSAYGTRIDPYMGPNNPTSATGEWTSQPNAYPNGLVGTDCAGAPSVGYFSVIATPITQTITQGSSVSYVIQVNSVDGYNGSVSVQGINLPTGYDPWRTTMTPEVVAISPGNPATATLTIGTNSSTSTGTHSITLRGTTGTLEDETSVQLTINAGQTTQTPILDGYSLTFPPLAGESFHGSITGRRFVPGSTRAYFCMESTTICYEHPNSGMTGSTETLLTFDNARLGEGRWQIFVHTPGGASNRSAAFSVTAPPNPTIAGYTWSPSAPYGSQPFGGTVTGSNFVAGNTRLFFCGGIAGCLEHPSGLINVTSPASLTVSGINLAPGSWKFYVRTGSRQSEISSPFNVLWPAVSSYTVSPSAPTANSAFSGEVIGAGFASGTTKLYACVNGSQTCYEHPASLTTVSSSTRLTFTGMNLGQGSYQFAVQVSGWWSGRTGTFTVGGTAAPTITDRSLSPSPPIANSPFTGSVFGTGFVSGSTKLWLCVNGSSTCYEHPTSLFTVASSTRIDFWSMNAGQGTYQFSVQVNGVWSSNRSASFTIAAPPTPTIGGYSWSPNPPRARQNFGGSVTGTNFVTGSGNTRVFFCKTGTSTCYEHPSSGISVSSSSNMSLSRINLDSGSWQFEVRTSAGTSSRSSSFNITPAITGVSWSSTPRASVPFGGSIGGNGFVTGSGNTRVFFCVGSTSTCYEHPGAGINVTSATSITLSGVNLGGGSWQVYVRTSYGDSNRWSFSVATSIAGEIDTASVDALSTVTEANRVFRIGSLNQ